MAAILFCIFDEEKQNIQLGIHHIQRPRNRLKRMDTIFYSKMPLTSSFSGCFSSLITFIVFISNMVLRKSLYETHIPVVSHINII